ncbi:hypothetical protein PFLUV_G00185610 [Perca fluviatilis]|uniref:Uncharacterized protein n=1 Tax=Perca fluviatilis TaxID=8168 RepID=A0A6A5EG99_PERFL|nr:hypothetical protein PFLUV_G00185610 [Perca fluviatilis]
MISIRRPRGLAHSEISRQRQDPGLPSPRVPRVLPETRSRDGDGLRGIRLDRGFRDPTLSWVWCGGVCLGTWEIRSAERRLLQGSYPDQTEDQLRDQQGFLQRFTTSPAFLKSSRLGSYRFHLPLEQVLEAYSQQFCFYAPPVMRVFNTTLYKQEVNHVVLVHSPDQDQFSDYPLLTDHPDAVCTYRDGCFIWRPEAMSETHRH